MAFFEFPHTRTYDSDLGWLIKAFNEITEKLNQYLENAVITFADPITWDITEQYTALTCVIDSDGTAYLSKQPVPAGVPITNTNYWLPIFNYDDNINQLRSQIAYNAQTSATTGVALTAGDLVFWNGYIYQVLVDMSAGTAFIEGTNITPYTVDQKINDIADSVSTAISTMEGDITNLQDQIALNAGDSATTPEDLVTGQLVFWNEQIYEVLTDMPAGTAFIDGTNVQQYTVDARIQDLARIKATQYYYRPEEYGAVGDGVTDDTQAIQDMFDDMPDNSCAIFTKRKYLVSNTLTFTKSRCKLSSGYSGLTEYHAEIYNTLASGDLLVITGQDTALEGLIFSGLGRGAMNGYVILFDNDNLTQDGNTDSFVTDCIISRAEYGIGVKGRNLFIRNTMFSGVRIGVDWLQTSISTELRGHSVENCRFHGVAVCVRNQIDNLLPEKGCTIQNNICDGGTVTMFSGKDGNINILNNSLFIISSVSGGGNIIEMAANAYASSTDAKNVISGNVLKINGKNYCGIFLNNVKAIVTNNYIEDLQRRGVAAAGGAKAYIMHNIVSKSLSWAYQIEAGSDGIIANNLAISCGNNASGGTGSTNNLTAT